MGRTTSGCAFVYRQDACYLSTLSHSSGFLVGNNHLHVTEMTPPPPPHTHTHTHTHLLSLPLLSFRLRLANITSWRGKLQFDLPLPLAGFKLPFPPAPIHAFCMLYRHYAYNGFSLGAREAAKHGVQTSSDAVRTRSSHDAKRAQGLFYQTLLASMLSATKSLMVKLLSYLIIKFVGFIFFLFFCSTLNGGRGNSSYLTPRPNLTTSIK